MKNRSLRLAGLLAAGGLCHAQADLIFEDGVLGEQVLYEVTGGDPLDVYVVMPSFDEGPTPLALVDPSDPRVLGVGLDLGAYWASGLLDASGEAVVALPIPLIPAAAGLWLYAQAVTLPGASTLVDDVTPRVEFQLAVEGDSHLTDAPTVRRRHHAAVLLDDLTVLLAGGIDPATAGGPPVTVQSTFELYDTQTQSFVGLGPLPGAVMRPASVLLDDGTTVLLIGGVGPGGTILSSVIEFDGTTGAAAFVSPMSNPRVFHTATLLDDGRVLVVGGSADYDLPHPIGYPGSLTTFASTTTELYDPATDTWTAGPTLNFPITGHSATKVLGGDVLFAGGVVDPPGPPGPQTTAVCRLFDAVTETFGPAPPMPSAVAFHADAETSIGGVLVVGGGVAVLGPQPSFTGTAATALYDPTTDARSWSAGAPTPGLMGPDGTIICVCRTGKIEIPREGGGQECPMPVTYHGGGFRHIDDLVAGTVTEDSNYYTTDSSVTAWTATGATIATRGGPEIVVLGDQVRTFVTGEGDGAASSTAEIWVIDY